MYIETHRPYRWYRLNEVIRIYHSKCVISWSQECMNDLLDCPLWVLTIDWYFLQSIRVQGYGNPTKVACNNQQKHTFTTGSVGTFLLIAVCHLSRVPVAQDTYGVHYYIWKLSTTFTYYCYGPYSGPSELILVALSLSLCSVYIIYGLWQKPHNQFHIQIRASNLYNHIDKNCLKIIF